MLYKCILVLFCAFIYFTWGKIEQQDKMEMQSQLATMENELNNLFQQTMSEVQNTIDGRRIQLRNKGEYRRAVCAEQFGRNIANDIEIKGQVDLIGLAGYFKVRRERIILPETNENDLEAMQSSLNEGSVQNQTREAIDNFKTFISQKMKEYLQRTTKC